MRFDMCVFDGHCDTIYRCYTRGDGFRENTGHLDLARMCAHGPWAQFFAIFWSKEEGTRPLFQVFREQAALFEREIRNHADVVAHCRTAAELEEAWRMGKQAAFLSVEGAELLACDEQALEQAYHLGVRAVNLTWNFENALSGSNAEASEKGLTAKGRSFVRKMEQLGMLIDVSHLSDPGFWDVLEETNGPIFASHSNARAVWPHKRNLTDAQFTAIIERHGTAGINMSADFLGADPGVDDIVRHIEHWFSLGGENNVSLGGDWDGISRTPKDICGIQNLDRLAERLLQLNYREQQVHGLFYQNLMRVVKEVCIM